MLLKGRTSGAMSMVVASSAMGPRWWLEGEKCATVRVLIEEGGGGFSAFSSSSNEEALLSFFVSFCSLENPLIVSCRLAMPVLYHR